MNFNNIQFCGLNDQNKYNNNALRQTKRPCANLSIQQDKVEISNFKTESGLFGLLKKHMKDIEEAKNVSTYTNNYNNGFVNPSLSANSSKPTHLKYRKAKTIMEAQAYAKQVLGIQRFAISDLETANQINYSITKAYNKTQGNIGIPDEVEYADIVMEHEDKTKFCPAQVQVHSRNGKVNKYVLQINKDIYNKANKSLLANLSEYARNGQIIKNGKGEECLELICGYRYSESLNRYLRLYSQGKLSKKAIVDFEQMVARAKEEESLILTKKNALNEIIKSNCNKDISKIGNDSYESVARQCLLKLRREKGIIIPPHCNDAKHMHSAAGLDGYILHELGHILHINEIGVDGLNKNIQNHKYGKNINELRAALKVSIYAGMNANEGVAEIVAGLLSNDKYPDDVMDILNKYMPKTKIIR